MADTKPSFLKNSVVYVSTAFVSQPLLLAQQLIIRFFIDPAKLGVWNKIKVVQSMADSFDVGLLAAAFRDLLVLRGAKEGEKEVIVRSTALLAKLGQAVLYSLLVFLYGAIFSAPEDSIAIYVAAVIFLVLAAFNEAFGVFHQACHLYIVVSRVQTFYSIIMAVALSLGAYIGGVRGVVLSSVLVECAQALLWWWSSREHKISVRVVWCFEVFKKLLSFGFWIRIVDVPHSIQSIMDVTVLSRFFSYRDLAIYVTAKNIAIQASELPARLGLILQSRLYEGHGMGRSMRDLGDDLKVYFIITYLLLLPVTIILTHLFFGGLVIFVIPKYRESLGILGTLLMLVFFLPRASVIRNIWILSGNLKSLGTVNLVGLLFSGSLMMYQVKTRPGDIKAIAMAMVIGFLFYHILLIWRVGNVIWDRSTQLLMYLVTALSVLLTARALYALDLSKCLDLKDLILLGPSMLAQVALDILPLTAIGLVLLYRSFGTFRNWIVLKLRIFGGNKK